MEEKIKNKIIKSYEQYLDCYQKALFTICKRDYHKSVMLISFISWELRYEKKEKILWKNIDFSKPEAYIQLLKKWYGIEMIYHSICGDDAIEKIKDGLNKDINLIIQIDGFDCSWNAAYKKHHLPHTIEIYGYDENKGRYQCHDPFYSIEMSYEISVETIRKSVYSVTEIKNVSEKQQYNIVDILEILANSYGGKKEEIERCYNGLIEHFKEVTDVKELFLDEEDPELTDLILRCKNISNNRYALSSLLFSNGYKEENDRFDIAEAFFKTGKLWKKICIKLMQMEMNRCLELDMIYENLEEIKWSEILILEKLSKYRTNRG